MESKNILSNVTDDIVDNTTNTVDDEGINNNCSNEKCEFYTQCCESTNGVECNDTLCDINNLCSSLDNSCSLSENNEDTFENAKEFLSKNGIDCEEILKNIESYETYNKNDEEELLIKINSFAEDEDKIPLIDYLNCVSNCEDINMLENTVISVYNDGGEDDIDEKAIDAINEVLLSTTSEEIKANSKKLSKCFKKLLE